jgi:hypothetical protein
MSPAPSPHSTHCPPWQTPSSSSQVSHSSPPVPQAWMVVPGRQVPGCPGPPVQQPLGQVCAEQMHSPPTHTWPDWQSPVVWQAGPGPGPGSDRRRQHAVSRPQSRSLTEPSGMVVPQNSASAKSGSSSSSLAPLKSAPNRQAPPQVLPSSLARRKRAPCRQASAKMEPWLSVAAKLAPRPSMPRKMEPLWSCPTKARPAKSHSELVLPGSGSGHESVPQQAGGGGVCPPPDPPRRFFLCLRLPPLRRSVCKRCSRSRSADRSLSRSRSLSLSLFLPRSLRRFLAASAAAGPSRAPSRAPSVARRDPLVASSLARASKRLRSMGRYLSLVAASPPGNGEAQSTPRSAPRTLTAA